MDSNIILIANGQITSMNVKNIFTSWIGIAALLISQLAQKLSIRDLSVTEANIEDVVGKVYGGA